MGPTEFNRTVLRGDSLFFLDQVYQDVVTKELFTLPVTNPPTPPRPGSAPFNLTGCELWYTAKFYRPDPDLRAVWALNTAALGGVAIINALIGTFSVTGSPLATVGFPDGDVTLAFDIQIKDATGKVFTIEKGTQTVEADVTRAVS
jgi:hypothetical protein